MIARIKRVVKLIVGSDRPLNGLRLPVTYYSEHELGYPFLDASLLDPIEYNQQKDVVDAINKIDQTEFDNHHLNDMNDKIPKTSDNYFRLQ